MSKQCMSFSEYIDKLKEAQCSPLPKKSNFNVNAKPFIPTHSGTQMKIQSSQKK